MNFILPSSSSILAWQGYSAIPQLIYIPLSQWIIQLLVLFCSHLSMASKAISSHIMMTWSYLHIPSFIQHSVICLGLAVLLATTRRQSSKRKCQSQQKSCVKAYPLPSVNSSHMSILLALTRNQTINISISSSYSAWKQRLISPSKCHHCICIPRLAQIVNLSSLVGCKWPHPIWNNRH